MAEKKLDRRVRRTRKLLQNALIELVFEKGFDSLTITEITERAALRRATFYLHYATKEELLLSTLEETLDTLVEESKHVTGGDVIAGKTRPDAYQITYDHIMGNADLYRALLNGSGGALVSQRIREYLADLVLNSLHQLPQNTSPIPHEVIAQYIAGSELALITWWLNNDMPYTSQEMATMSHKLVLTGLQGVLGEKLYTKSP